MKHTLKLSAAALLLSALSASAAYQVTVRNFTNSTNGFPIIDNAGNPLANGLIGVGTFPVGFDFNVPAADVLAAFQQFGASVMEPPLSTGGFPGLFNNTISGSIPNTSTAGDAGFFGDQIYTVIGDATSSLGDASFLAVLTDGGTFGKEDTAGNGAAAADYAPASTTGVTQIAYGDLVNGPFAIGPFTFAVGAQQVNVPEPSTSLLAGLAGLALLVRRRR
ncbi:MAG: PEP-CTERM sorting domain-containing protein [Akkermansiaceae bacterium]|nr:PEP-CTERM sorting domain-containing protein [Akkermansiaceae bacterium]